MAKTVQVTLEIDPDVEERLDNAITRFNKASAEIHESINQIRRAMADLPYSMGLVREGRVSDKTD